MLCRAERNKQMVLTRLYSDYHLYLYVNDFCISLLPINPLRNPKNFHLKSSEILDYSSYCENHPAALPALIFI